MASRFQYASSLQRKAPWNSLIPELIRSKSSRWKEADFSTHDVQLPIAKPPDAPERTLCGLFLGPNDVGLEETENRLQRLYHLNGGRDVVVLFLMEQTKLEESPVEAFAKLQLSMVGGQEIHVVPINSIQMAMRSIYDYQWLLSVAGRPHRPPGSAYALLPYCCSGPNLRLSEHTFNVLTDVTTSLRDMLHHLCSEGGQMRLEQYVGADVNQLSSFWTEEYLAE